MSRAPHTMSVEVGGRVLDMAIHMPPGAGQVQVRPIRPIAPRTFETCPICCAATATTDEHVPPHAMGGSVMTQTCEPCNNRLGSRVEGDLIDWYDGALTLPRFAADAVQGARRANRILFRTTKDGEFVFVLGSGVDPAVFEMLSSGAVDLAALAPDENRLRIALLKHAYLAACLLEGAPLEGEDADDVRRELVTARDAQGRQSVPHSDIAAGLTVLRFGGESPPLRHSAVWAIAERPDGPCHGVILGGSVFVSWSSSLEGVDRNLPPARGVSARLIVGGKLEAVMTGVTS